MGGGLPGYRLLFVASEAAPYVKSGGLGDVVGALPRALAALGHEATVVLPFYRRLIATPPLPHPPALIEAPLGERRLPGRVFELPPPAPGVRVLLVDQPVLFGRVGLYQDESGRDYADNCERYVYLCRAAFEAAEALNLAVDCIHAHDWQTGLVPIYLREIYASEPRFRTTASVFTIHNLAYQGVFETQKWPFFHLDRKLLQPEGIEQYLRICLLKAGIVGSDIFTTVSRSYAREIQSSEFGCGLDEVIVTHAERLVGIVNGIDYQVWNPAADPQLCQRYTPKTWRTGKASCKQRLLASFGLPTRADAPLVGFVSRLVDQKGCDLLERTIGAILDLGVQMVLLGTGNKRYEALFAELAQRRGDVFAARLAFDEPLSHEIYAGCDMFLMPSRFEPCGLSQLYALRYGAVPIVRAVGGLADTVVDATPAALADGTATGVVFEHYAPISLTSAVRRAVTLYRNPRLWEQVVERGMAQDWSWQTSAQEYVRVYGRAIERARHRAPIVAPSGGETRDAPA
jgi:starch synthase